MYITVFAFIFLTACSNNNEVLEEIIENEDEEIVNEPENCKIIDNDGLLILEAESFDLKGKWRILEDEKASNGKYIEYYGSNSYNTQNLDHEISVKFTVDKASNYLVRWYMRQPDDAEGDKSNDVWIYFPENLGTAKVNNETVVLNKYEKFVSRGKGEFTYGGALDLHNSSSWMRVNFPEAGEYTLNICARSEYFQLDKIVLSMGMSDADAKEKSKTLSETTTCDL